MVPVGGLGWTLLVLLLTLSGAQGAALAAGGDGQTLFQQSRFAEARQALAQEVARDPGNARLNHLLGRSCLAENAAAEALPYLQKAVALEPGNAEFHFWEGLAQWAQLDFEAEQASYRRALELDPNHLPAHVYMGHSLMDQGLWAEALKHYERVLQDVPDHPEALFNSALSLHRLERPEEERAAWKRFLGYYNTGSKALAAVEQLNTNGDFSFRPLVFGPPGVVLEQVPWPAGAEAPDPEALSILRQAGRAVLQNPELTLQVVAYLEGALQEAEARARFVKSYLLEQFPGIGPQRIRISWFGVPETLDTPSGTVALSPSLRLFTESAKP